MYLCTIRVCVCVESAAQYSDPLGPQAERPRTAMARRGGPGGQVEFGNEQLGDDLLPE
jgi:intraflagellar transport protein 88